VSTGGRKDPYRGFNFKLEIDGVVRAAFQQASGLDADAGEAQEEEDATAAARKLPGLNKYSNITLKRGMTGDHSLSAWHKQSISGTVERKNGSIVLLDEAGEEKLRWNFVGGWPKKWDGPSLNANTKDVAIETLEIAHEGLTKA
jgi:phage tail-like protein